MALLSILILAFSHRGALPLGREICNINILNCILNMQVIKFKIVIPHYGGGGALNKILLLGTIIKKYCWNSHILHFHYICCLNLLAIGYNYTNRKRKKVKKKSKDMEKRNTLSIKKIL